MAQSCTGLTSINKINNTVEIVKIKLTSDEVEDPYAPQAVTNHFKTT
jgi:hypothetical protein